MSTGEAILVGLLAIVVVAFLVVLAVAIVRANLSDLDRRRQEDQRRDPQSW